MNQSSSSPAAGEAFELYEAMRTLRAVRRLKPDPVPEPVLHRVLEAASWAPTGANLQPWRALVVSDPALKRELGKLYAERWRAYVADHRRRLEGQPEAVVTAAERTLRAGDYLADNFAQVPVVVVFCFDARQMAITDSGLDRVSVVGGASVYPAVENMLLACRAEGLGCVLTTLLCAEEPRVTELLEIPAPWATAAAIPVGYPVGRGHGPIRRKPVERLAFRDRWGAPFEAEGESS